MPIIQPDSIHVGRGDVYLGVAVPGTPPIALAGGVPGSGRFLGATLSPANFTYRAETVIIPTQQDTTLHGQFITAEELILDFEIGELAYLVIKDAWTGGVGASTYVTMGGVIIPTALSVLLISPRADGAYIEAMIYEAVLVGERSLTFSRAGTSGIKVTARGQGVPSRTAGDRLGFLHPHVVSS